MGKKYIFKFVNIYGVKMVTYFMYDEDGNLSDTDYLMLGEFDDMDIYEKRLREDFAKYLGVEIIIERLDKLK